MQTACMVSDDTVSSLGGSTFWKPLCHEVHSTWDQLFPPLDHSIKFSREYVVAWNFEVRLGRQRLFKGCTITPKYLHCNKEGMSRVKGKNTLSGVPTLVLFLSRSNCDAKIALSKAYGGYVVSEFVEAHNHLIATPARSQFMKCSRVFTFPHMRLLATSSMANIGRIRRN